MSLFYCDASALAKTYTGEAGAGRVDHLLAEAGPGTLFALFEAYAEVVSVLVRKRNAGTISAAVYQRAAQTVRADMVLSGQFQLLSTTDPLVLACTRHIERHSLNATDALVLASALDLAAAVRSAGASVVLVAADQRLLRAGAAEGLAIFNPETDSIPQLDTLLALS